MRKKMNLLNNESLKEKIATWNATYPYDRWWRKKHKVAFGSKKHLEQNPIDQKLEFLEDVLLLESKIAINELDSLRKGGSLLKNSTKKDLDEDAALFDEIKL